MMRALRRRLSGLLATLTILGIIAGLPIALLNAGGNPFAQGLPSLDRVVAALTAPDDGSLLIVLITVVGWVTWAMLTSLIGLEILAALRGIRTPKLPGLRLPQNAARNLVSTALLLFVTAPLGAGIASATPTTAPSPPPPAAAAQHPASPPAVHAQPVHADAKRSTAAAPAPAKRIVHVTVQPGDSLWSIAKDKLGDGRKYREIIASNPHLLKGKANFIKPGWKLKVELPPKATPAGDTVVVQRGDSLSSIAADHLGDPDRFPEIFKASRGIKQPHGAHLTDPDVIDVGWTLRIPSDEQEEEKPASRPKAERREPSEPTEQAPPPPTATPVPQATTPTATPNQTQAEHEQQTQTTTEADNLNEEPSWRARTPYGVGAFLAAGVVVLLAARRRAQQHRRRPGQRLPAPTGETTQRVERELRVTADQLSVETVDVALRALAQHCAATATPLPNVRAARLTGTQFDLYLTDPAHLPSPWTSATETVWSLDNAAAHLVEALDLSGTPAPWPSLVTVGHDDEDGHVLLDLERLGTLGLRGAGDAANLREVLAALAIELATSAWADDLQVTLVGAFPELADTMQTGRIRYAPAVNRVLEEVADRVRRDREALSAARMDLHTARVTGTAPDAWAPEIILIAGALTPRQRAQIAELSTGQPPAAVAFVTADAMVGEWSMDLNADPSRATLSPIGLDLQPQRVPVAQYAELLEMLELSDVAEVEGAAEAAEPTLADVHGVMADVDLSADVASGAAPAEEGTSAGVPQDQAESAGVEHEPHDDEPDSSPLQVVGSEAAALAPGLESDDARIPSGDEHAEIHPIPLPAPHILALGPVQLVNAGGRVEPSKRARLLEFAAYLVLHPGATHTAIDDAIWPDRKTEDNLNTRNTATSKLRRWVSTDPDGQEYLPRHQTGGGYRFLPSVSSDIHEWDELLRGDPLHAHTDQLEAALKLVRGIPFEGTHVRRYVWCDPIKQRLISEIVDASYELARRRLMSGRWRAAEEAIVIGLRIEPAQENLWRLRILAAHESRNADAEAEAIERLLTITERIDCELDPETEELISALKQPGTQIDLATAL